MPGRMAQRVVSVAQQREGVSLVAAVARDGSSAIGQDAGRVSHSNDVGIAVTAMTVTDFSLADVWIEFATAESTPAIVAACVKAKRPLVVCTTGHKDTSMFDHAAKQIPILVAANTSLGVAVANALIRKAVSALPAADIEVVELHHKAKRDAPSGTALRMVDTVIEQRGLQRDQLVTGRTGMVGERTRDEIGVLAVRGGGTIGEHTVYLMLEDERIEITHRAGSRDLFASGAIAAARWLQQQVPGRYVIEQVLGL